MKHKYLVLFFILFLSIGFAGISTKFIINGEVNIAFDDNTFIVVFENSSSDNGTPVISNNEKTLNFKTNTLKSTSDTATLEFSIANKSKSYDANVDVTCELKDSASLSQYIDMTSNINNPELVEASSRVSNILTINMKQENTSGINPEVVCTLNASPVSRSTENEGEFSLNGADPVLDDEGKLIPVKLSDTGVVTYTTETDTSWHDYSKKKWANAVILIDNPSKTYQVNDIIPEDDIESYFVWIPRFKYRIFNEGNYTGLQDKLPISNKQEIQIRFESIDAEARTGTKEGEWLTHPAFTNYNTNGIWVGKFETGYAGATSYSAAQQNVNDSTKVVVKPNVYSWRGITVSNIFKTSLSYEESLNSHMMRNTEWGAVAYLSHSKYGINDEVRINNNSNFLTGYAANEKEAEASTNANSTYNTSTGYLASTTGNITGIYDISGGTYEYVAGYRANTPGDSGFTTTDLEKYANHLDVYNTSSTETTYNYRILGDATGEMGPFYNIDGRNKNNWYDDHSSFVNFSGPWFIRGGYYGYASNASQFVFGQHNGGTYRYYGFRIVIANTKSYKEKNLNGADPVLDEAEKLVPVNIADNGEVTYADPKEEWYNYENKEWANVVILVDSPSKTYNVGNTIAEEDIESYFVWIPRYRYQIFDKGEYTGTQAKLSNSIAKEIKIEFEGKDTTVSTGSEVGDWLTHPAFTNYNTNGIWVGKFETGYQGAASSSDAERNITDASKIIVKPNVYSWRNITVSNIFKNTLAYEESLNSHMMRNTEWGVVAYLSHSKYGINDEVRINNNSNFLTGYAANEKDADSSTTNNSSYNTEKGYLASTTGNISGVYDMSGGSWEYVAGHQEGIAGNSGFTVEELTTYANHFDIYNASASVNSYNYRILGDATGEMGPFYYDNIYYRNNWYSDRSNFLDSSNIWFLRGGYYYNSSNAGIFYFHGVNGGTNRNNGFRIVLALKK